MGEGGEPLPVVWMYDAEAKRWLRFQNLIRILQSKEREEVVPLLEEAQIHARTGYVAGFLSYESAGAFDPALITYAGDDFPCLWLGLFKDREEVDLPKASMEAQLRIEWQAEIDQARYVQDLQRIHAYLEAGDTYQVNHTFRLRAPAVEDFRQLFLRMVEAQGSTYGAWIETEEFIIASASPELFFSLSGEHLVSIPMKGTMPRGKDSIGDRKKGEELRRSEKNRAENLMIVDMVRNDLGRIAEKGTVKVESLFDVTRYPTVWQMTSTVSCQTKAQVKEIFQALFPAASITGAPKVRTMEIIRELETSARKIYTGSIGFWGPQRAQFNVAIRTVLLDRRRKVMEYGIGGGIVWDSTAEAEYEECLKKAEILTHVLTEFRLFETLRWTQEGGYYLLEEHLERMAGSAEYFGFSFDRGEAKSILESTVKGEIQKSLRVRLYLGRVKEKLGHPILECEKQPLMDLPQPYRVSLAKEPVSTEDIFLYHKTTERKVYEKARSQVEGCEDVILWNERGELTEATIANLVLQIDGKWYTPPIESGLLGGVQRGVLLAEGKLGERILYREDLGSCEGIYLLNSVRGMWKVVLV